jgi:hypothetical protein
MRSRPHPASQPARTAQLVVVLEAVVVVFGWVGAGRHAGGVQKLFLLYFFKSLVIVD